MVNDLTTLNTYNLQHNFLILWISSMQQIRLCVVNKTFCFDKKTSNFHKKQTLAATLDQKVCLALWSITCNCSENETAVLFVAGLFRLQKDWMNKTNLCELQRVVKKMSTFIALLMRNDGLKILSFFIFYYLLCSFCHKFNGSGFNPPTHFRHISDKRGKMSVDVAPKSKKQIKHNLGFDHQLIQKRFSLFLLN